MKNSDPGVGYAVELTGPKMRYWNQNDHGVIAEIENRLHLELMLSPTAHAKAHRALQGRGLQDWGDREDVICVWNYLVIEKLDNQINQGDKIGGYAWTYEDTEFLPGVRPPGKTGEKKMIPRKDLSDVTRYVGGDNLLCKWSKNQKGFPSTMQRLYTYESRWRPLPPEQVVVHARTMWFFLLKTLDYKTLWYDTIDDPENPLFLPAKDNPEQTFQDRERIKEWWKNAGGSEKRKQLMNADHDELKVLKEIMNELSDPIDIPEKTQVPGSPQKETIAGSLLLAITKPAEEALQEAIKSCRGESGQKRYYYETRLFLRYVLALCRPEPDIFYQPFGDWREETLGSSSVEAYCERTSVEEMAAQSDRELWARLVQQNTYFGELNDADKKRDLYKEWFQACMEVVGGPTQKTKENNTQKCEGRAEDRQALEDFYLLIGRTRKKPNQPTAACGKVQGDMKQYFQENRTPEDMPEEDQDHLMECADCFWAFSDYEKRQYAMGWRPPHPLRRMGAAALRQLWDTIGGWERSVQEAWNALPSAELPQRVGSPVRQGEAQRAEAQAEVEITYLGTPLSPGEIEISLMEVDGSYSDHVGTVRILETTWNPEEQSVCIDLQVVDLPANVPTVAVSLVVNRERISVPADIHEGAATICIADIPAEIRSLDIDEWYGILYRSPGDTNSG